MCHGFCKENGNSCFGELISDQRKCWGSVSCTALYSFPECEPLEGENMESSGVVSGSLEKDCIVIHFFFRFPVFFVLLYFLLFFSSPRLNILNRTVNIKHVLNPHMYIPKLWHRFSQIFLIRVEIGWSDPREKMREFFPKCKSKEIKQEIKRKWIHISFQ